MSQEHGFCDHRPSTAWLHQADDHDDQVDEKDEDIAHGVPIVVRSMILTSLRKPRGSAMNKNSQPTGCQPVSISAGESARKLYTREFLLSCKPAACLWHQMQNAIDIFPRSRQVKSLFTLVATLVFLVPPKTSADDAYINGHWFDGSGFVERTVFVSDGLISLTQPEQIGHTYDLAGAFVVPPFGEAHNHDLTTDFEPQERINEYLHDGVFYAKMQSAFSKGFDMLSPHFNNPESIDVRFAFAPITGPGGHPIRIRQLFFDRGYYEGIFNSKDEIPGIGYTEVEDREELLRKWPNLIRQKPDFIKVMLSHSEEYDLRKDDPEYFGFKGIDPDLVPDLVELAHAEGLSVTAHIDTAADFHNAISAGVDEIAHLPGTDEREVIRSRDAIVAAEKDIAIITTISLTTKIKDNFPNYYDEIMKQHARNLQRLKDAGARILVGSDMPYRDTSMGEVFLLYELGIFTNEEILTMWCETTPRSIFPGRNIGRLDEGYEASFLALGGNPIDDFEQVNNILMRVKQGRPLVLEDLNQVD